MTKMTPDVWTMGDAADRNNAAKDVANEQAWRVDEYDDEDRVPLLHAADTVIALRARIETLEKALREIAEGEGRFNRDRLTHACNTVEDMKALATDALAAEEKSHHIVDDDNAGFICEFCGRGYLDLRDRGELDKPCAALAAEEKI